MKTSPIFLTAALAVVVVLIGAIGVDGKDFNNAYIQNVKSGRCLTIENDVNYNPLMVANCKCGPYQFWRMENKEKIINELAWSGYMDQIDGVKEDGKKVGVFTLGGWNWQKWTVNEDDDGNFQFVERQNKKCLYQSSGGNVVHWECDDDDPSQKWKVIENPCGKRPKLPERFQIQNVETGRCAVVENDKDFDFARVVTHKCSCSNDHHYWKYNKRNLVSQGPRKQCLANWEHDSGHPGITICGCGDNDIHNWAFLPMEGEEGTTHILSQKNGQCIYVNDEDENTPVHYTDCDRKDNQQKWKIFKCNEDPLPPKVPPPASLIPPITREKNFKNAYIVNVDSGRCITIEKDINYNPLLTSNCKCGPYQFWRMEDDEKVINELAHSGYMDQIDGAKEDGKKVGIFTLGGWKWQKWNLNKNDDGTFQFVEQQNKKCLHESSGGAVVHWDCDDEDPKQQWKIIENPCGKPLKRPKEKFQLQNIETGKCAVIEDDKDVDFSRVVTHNCNCENDNHYWSLNNKNLVSQGKNKRCIANWENDGGHPGVTICGCGDNEIHNWAFLPMEDDGSTHILSQKNGQCLFVNDESENTPVRYANCDRRDAQQRWRYFDSCNPEPPAPPPPPPAPSPPPPAPSPPSPQRVTNVIPSHLEYFFENHQMNWLNPTRYTLLIGGRWESTTQTWYTANGLQIKPGTEMWTMYFGDAKPSLLNMLFSGGNTTWNSVFGWMSYDFFKTWNTTTETTNEIPSYLEHFFNGGQMSWLTPERYNLLIGGRWDSSSSTWYTSSGTAVRPGTDEWTIYFGNAQPSFLNVLFSGGNSSWNDVFGWMTPQFFTIWRPTPPPPIIIIDPPTYVDQYGNPVDERGNPL